MRVGVAVRGAGGVGGVVVGGGEDGAAKAVHFGTVRERPDEGTTRGDLRHGFRLYTDIPGEPPLELTATLRVEP